MPLQATSGAASYDGFGGGVVAEPNYIESCFSTYLYTGTAAALTITNNIDLSTKGGLVWLKPRATNAAGNSHQLFDTSRGVQKYLQTNATAAEATASSGRSLTAFNTTGFSLGLDYNGENSSGITYASWTFRKQPKFFDIVTYTGNGVAGRTVAHSLGSTPACIIVKAYSVDTGDYWGVYHRSLGATKAIFLSATNAAATSSIYWNNTEPTSTNFTVGDWSGVNQNGTSYVAYLFAHDAGGFGLTGTDNVISCGSFTAGSSVDTNVSLGYEPQWILVKASSTTGNWRIIDSMRGIPTGTIGGADDATLSANLSDAESLQGVANLSSTGFAVNFGGANQTYIYIAIRRGPMKVPTSGTSVFYPISQTGNADNTSVGFSPDWTPFKISNGVGNWAGYDRLRGINQNLQTNTTAAESTVSTIIDGWLMNGVDFGSGIGGTDKVFVPCFKRAPSFFDEVCYSGTGVAKTEAHNLGAVPELMIVKSRAGTGRDWAVYTSATAATNFMYLNGTDASGASSSMWNDTTPTSSVFTVGTNIRTNNSGQTYVAYLFATCAGVSKVFSYTGNGSSQTINCGFTAGSRWVMIKRTDSTGDWYVWDSARGIIAGNDPHLSLNTTAAEVTTDDSVDTDNTGFIVNQLAATNINVTSATYIGIAIA